MDYIYELKKLFRADIPGNFNEFDLLRSNWGRIQHVFQGNSLPPYEVLIHPSRSCNLRCKWCIGKNVDLSRKFLPEKLYNTHNMLSILQSLTEYKVQKKCYKDGELIDEVFKVENVTFSGLIGEPLMAGHALIEGMEYLLTEGLRTGIFTNGLLINEENVKTLANLSYILISIDAVNNSTYKEMKCFGQNTSENCVDRVIQNIRLLVSERAKQNSQIEINAGFVVNEYNYKEIFQLAKILKENGVSNLRLKMDIAVKLVLSEEQREDVVNQIERIRSELEDSKFSLIELHRITNLLSSDQTRLFDKCLINRIFGAIGPDGRVYACNYHAAPSGTSFGSVLEKPFKEIWEMGVEIDVKKHCPGVCDPYKNRANNMLNILYKIFRERGIEETDRIVSSIIKEIGR